MKNLFVLFLGLFIASSAFAQGKKKASPLTTSESDNVSIIYSAPSVKGRVIFGDLVPFDKVWRTGANAATTVTFNKDVTFGGEKVAAGTYALFTIPSEGDWTVILNSDAKQWGAYKMKEDKNVVEIKVPSTTTEATEVLEINAEDSSISIKWATTAIEIPLEF